MTEEFGFQQRLRYGCAIDGEERAGCPRRLVVNEARDALFTGTAFTCDEHSGVDLRDASREIECPQHRRTRADEASRHSGIDLSQRPAGLKLPFLLLERVTREVVLRVEQLGQTKDPWGNLRAAFSAKASIDRKDFGLTWNQVLETGGVMVGDRVEIEAEIQAVKQVEAQVA